MNEHTTLYFSTYSFTLLHTIIALIQLLKGHRYWWIVHVCMKVNQSSYIQVRLSDIAVVSKPPNGSRELYYYPQRWDARVVSELYTKYWLNCSLICSAGTVQPERYPAKLYAHALSYTKRNA